MAGLAQIRIQWILDLVDHNVGGKLLAQDRAIRSSLQETDRAYQRTAAESVGAAARQETAMARTAKAVERVGLAQSSTTRAGASYVTAQQEQIDQGTRLIARLDEVAGAYSRQAGAVRTVAAEESRLSRVRRETTARASALTARAGGGLSTVAGVTGLSAIGRGGLGLVAGGGLAVAGGLVYQGLHKGTEIASTTAGLSGLTGLPPQQATALAIIANAVGTNARSLGQAFGTLGKQVVKLEDAHAKGGKAAAKAGEQWEKLGITAQQVSSLKNNLPALFDLVYKQAAKLPQAERAGVLKTFLGRGAIVSGQIEAAGPLTQQIKEIGGAHLDPKKLEKLHITEIKLKEITTELELAFAETFGPPLIKIFQAITPAIKPIGEAFKDALQVPVEWLKKEGPGLWQELKVGLGLAKAETPHLAAGIAPIAGHGLGAGARVQPQRPSDGIVEQIGGALKVGGTEALKYGESLLNALKPAAPFLKNVLLPLIKGVGLGLVLAFKVALPVIEVLAKALGWVGKVLEPLGPAFKVFGAVVGLVLAGPILGLGTKLPLLGNAFKLLLLPIKAAELALIPFATALGRLGAPLFAAVTGGLSGLASKVTGIVGGAAAKGAAVLAGAGRAMAAAASGLVGAISGGLSALGGTLAGIMGAAGTRLAAAASLAGAAAGTALQVALLAGIAALGFFVGKALGEVFSKYRIHVDMNPLDWIKGTAPVSITSALGDTEKAINQKQLKAAVGKFGYLEGKRGGGMIGALVSPGERVLHGGQSWTVPGSRTAADSVYAHLPVGAAVLTHHGQHLLDSGHSLGHALARQAPHFASGGLVTASEFGGHNDPSAFNKSTASGKTANDALWGFAELSNPPAALNFSALGGLPMGTPITVAYHGHAISVPKVDKGAGGPATPPATVRAIDLTYRAARALGMGGSANVLWSPGGGGAPGTSTTIPSGIAGAASTIRLPIILPADRTREGLLPDALTKGIESGRAGLTGLEEYRATLGRRGAEGNPLVGALTEALGELTEEIKLPGEPKAKASKITGLSPRLAAMVHFAEGASTQFPQYVYGGGHSSFTGPFDCSGFVSAILHSGGFLSSPQSTDGLKSFGEAGTGKVTVGVRGTTGMGAHTMIKVGSSYWEAGGKEGTVGQRGGWDGTFPIKRHPHGYRRGGIVSRSLPSALRQRIARDPHAFEPTSPTFVGYGLRKGGVVAHAHHAHAASLYGSQKPPTRGWSVTGRTSTFGPPGESAGTTAYGYSSAHPGIAINPTGEASGWDSALARSLARKRFRVSVRGRSAILAVIDKGPFAHGRKIDVTGAGAAQLGFHVGPGGTGFPTDATATATMLRSGGVVGYQGGGIVAHSATFHHTGGARGGGTTVHVHVSVPVHVHAGATPTGTAIHIGHEGVRPQHLPAHHVPVGREPHHHEARTRRPHREHPGYELDEGPIPGIPRSTAATGFGTALLKLPPAAAAGKPQFEATLKQFQVSVAGLSVGGLEFYRKQLVTAARKPGSAAVIKSMQAAISAIDYALGQYIGLYYRQIEQLGKQAASHQNFFDRSLRKAGVEAGSVTGLTLTQGQDADTNTIRQQQVTAAEKALSIAKKTGKRDIINEANEKLLGAQEELDEAITKGIENSRALLRAKAQEATDQAKFGTESARNALSHLDIEQRLAQTGETPAGMIQRANAIQGTLLPSLQGNLGALNSQLGTLQQTGASQAELNQILGQIQTAGNDIGSAMAEAAELVRKAAQQAAAELVEHATHGTTLAKLGEAHLELEERIHGTYEGGVQQRTDYIKQTLVPALNSELSALGSQLQTARDTGDSKLAAQIGEAIAGKQNEILEEQLKVQEAVAENTKQHHVGGTLGFSYGSENLTDELVSVGMGG